jgi:formiminotetrahydrofolate cyclodeaminase
LASDAPTPGGGSAAALAGAAGAALASMVTNLTIGRKKYAEVEDEMRRVRTEAESLRRSLHGLIREDAKAYERYMTAAKLPKETDAEKSVRKAALGQAAVAAAEAPLETMRQALATMKLSAIVAAKGNRNAASDGGVGALFARAAIRAAGLNVRINLPSIQDETLRARMLSESETIERDAERIEAEALAATGL